MSRPGLSKTDPRRVRAAERSRSALALRRSGASTEQVASQLGISRQAAHKLIVRALERLARETAVDAVAWRALELERLDQMSLKVSAILSAPDVEPAVTLQAVSALTRISERRAKMLGLDSLPPPAKPDPTAATAEAVRPMFKGLDYAELVRMREHLLAQRAAACLTPAALAHPGLPVVPPPPEPTTPTDPPAAAPRPTPPSPPPAPWTLSLDFVGGDNVLDPLEDID